MHVRVLVSAILLWLFASSVQAAEITPAGINDSQWGNSANDEALLIKAQILLDRARFSPGEIDGRDGENYRKALTAFAREHSIESKGNLTEQLWRELSATSQEPRRRQIHPVGQRRGWAISG